MMNSPDMEILDPENSLRRRVNTTCSDTNASICESVTSNRSKRASFRKEDCHNSDLVRSKSTFSLHILDKSREYFETNQGEDTNEFINFHSNPINRLYFSMYLIHINQQNILFLYHDLSVLASDYSFATLNSKIQHAKQLYSLYLSSDARLPIEFSSEPRAPSIQTILSHFKSSLDSLRSDFVHQLNLLVNETLEKHYFGTFVFPQDIIWMGNSETSKENLGFKGSAFAQMLKKDMESSHLNHFQYQIIHDRFLSLSGNLDSLQTQHLYKFIEYYELATSVNLAKSVRYHLL